MPPPTAHQESGHPYVRETFTADEERLLAGRVTNTDRPVFALTGMPEVVKGALFARYSRSPKSLRRLLLDEFAQDLPAGSADGPGGGRAAQLYERVFVEYGDDSVAQLGGAHLAVEQASNLLTKILEWGRLASYLEQSTRYMTYDDKPGGRYRYHRPAEILASPHAAGYEATLDAVFDLYSACLPQVRAWAERRFPRDPATPEPAHRRAITAKSCDVLRGMLPAATVSNVGIFASGQAYESLLLRLRSSELAEARTVGDMMLTELRRVIPAFLVRVDQPHRGEVWADYLAATRADVRSLADELLTGIATAADAPDEVSLTWFDPDAETDLLVGMLYPHSQLPEARLRAVVERMSAEDRRRVVEAYTGDRRNRRHKPGRALERVGYRFDVCSDYGAFRDLQRHRMLTIEWQELSCRHGYDTPAAVEEAGVAARWHEAMDRQAQLWEQLLADLPRAAQYAVGFAWRLRYSMQLNARAAMQMLELRTGPQGHESYRRICQRMHRLIADEAGHAAVADMMRFVDHSGGELERLEAERVLEARRAARSGAERIMVRDPRPPSRPGAPRRPRRRRRAARRRRGGAAGSWRPHTPDEVLLRRYGHVRAIGGLLYLGTVAVLFVVYGTRVWPMLIGAAVLAVVTTAFFAESDAFPRFAVAASLVADLVVLAGAVLFFGGAGSGMVLLYAIPVVSAGILLGPSSATGMTALAVVVAVVQLAVEEAGLRPALVVTEDFGDRIAVLAVSIAGLASIGYLTGTYASRLHELLALSGADLAALRSSSRRRRGYADAAAEDIRTPLQDLERLADELEAAGEAGRLAGQGEPAPDDGRRLAAEMRMAAARLQAGVERLADVAAMDTIRDTRPEPVLLARVVEDCLTALRPELGGRTVGVDVAPIRVVADRRGARRIVYNLLENIAEHTPEGTRCEVTGFASAGRGILVVGDDGPGVPPERAGGLFDTRGAGGPAVGLPLVRELAEAMGAQVHYERARGGGARFMVSFRLAPPSATAADTPTSGRR